jgi:DNA-binding FadR family transcriptional regulator
MQAEFRLEPDFPVPAQRPQRLSDRVYESMLALIVSGDLPENSRLPTERELSQRYSVSRVIVREALARLRDDGLVESRQGSGTYVRKRSAQAVLSLTPISSIEDVQRCFEWRAALEGYSAYHAALRRDDEAISELAATLKALLEELEARRVAVEADFAFHLAVAKASKNRFFVSALLSVRTHMQFGMNLSLNLTLSRPVSVARKVQNEHQAIFDLIVAGDAENARRAMQDHLQDSRRRMFEGV